MRPIPVPASMVMRHWPGAFTQVLAGPSGDLVDDPIGPVEMVRHIVDVGDGQPTRASTAILVLEAGELELLAEGCMIALTLIGGHVQPFSLEVVEP